MIPIPGVLTSGTFARAGRPISGIRPNGTLPFGIDGNIYTIREIHAMNTEATGTFTSKSWDEKTYSEIEGGPKLTRASVINTYSGKIEGEGTLEYLLTYASKISCTFIGTERIVGSIGGRSGSIVLQHAGIYSEGGVKGRWTIALDSGTGDLAGIRGEGSYTVPPGEHSASYKLGYDMA